jgi:hypothetical protein
MIALLCGLCFSLLLLGVSIKTAYAASSALTITLASLATSSTWLAGAESDAIDNTSNLYLDYLLAGKITVGTSPTASTEIRVYVVALAEDATYPDVFDGTGSAETVTSAGVGSGFLTLVRRILVDATTSNQAYWFGPVSVASFFGGVLPKKFVIFVSHNSGVNLNSTAGNHAIYITPVYATSA